MKTLLPKLTALAVCLFFSSNIIFSQIDYKGFPEWSIESEGITNYALYTPSNIVPGNLYPIALFMHGCCGDDYVATLRNAVDPPVRMWHNFGENTQTEPTYIIAPATSSGWTQHFDNIIAVIDDLIANHQGDPQRVYVTGFSMGGGGTWDIINQYPDYFAAAMPMGMDMRGSATTIKDIPIWTNRGSGCPYSTNLENQVGSIRSANGDTRGGAEWVTGVNARFTEFEGVGHGVQWVACSTQDMVSWALDKVNDGNAYPNVFFNSPGYLEEFSAFEDVELDITALDSDGTITKVETYVNGILTSTLNSSPYLDTVSIHFGDNIIKAVAYDDGGKTRTATIIVRTNNLPAFTTTELPDARQGALYEKQISAIGNAPFVYEISELNDALPEGLSISREGLIKGIPVISGNYTIRINISDADEDEANYVYTLQVLPKNTDEVIITNASVETLKEVAVSKLKDLELPNTGSGNEVSVSEAGVYTGLTFIATPNASDEDNTSPSYLSFDVDEDVTVYIGYEVKNLMYSSTIPSWLSSYTLETDNEIVTQYRYREVYSKDFSAGTITIPGADAGSNNVDVNYIVMVKKQGTTLNTTPSITSDILPDGHSGYFYTEKLTALDGEGTITWSLVSGSLPTGFTLSSDGIISGPADAPGIYNFDVQAEDEDGDLITKSLSIDVVAELPMQAVMIVANDTGLIVNSPAVTLVLNNITNHSSTTQDIDMIAYTDNSTLITVSEPVKINDTTFSVTYSAAADQIGSATIYLETTDHNNSDTIKNHTIKPFTVSVVSVLNHAPQCNPIGNYTAGLNNKFTEHYINLTGFNDGDDGSQNVAGIVTSSNASVVSGLSLEYDLANETGTISFYPSNLGTTTITLTLMDDGGTEYGGINQNVITFQLTIVDSAGYLPPASISNEILMGGFNIFPNPCNDVINISAPDNNFYQVSLFSLNGKIIFKEDNCKTIPVDNYERGVYIIKINNNKEIIGQEKVIIQ